MATPSQLSSEEDEYFVFMLVNAYILLVATLQEVNNSQITLKINKFLDVSLLNWLSCICMVSVPYYVLFTSMSTVNLKLEIFLLTHE